MTKARDISFYGLGVGIQSAGSVISGTGFTTLNFIGAGNTFVVVDDRVDISITSGIGIQSAGSVISESGVIQLNFLGAGNTFAVNGNTVDVSINNVTTAGTATTATNLADAANITTGTIDSARLSGTYGIDISGNAATATTATTATNAGTATTATNIDISASSTGDTTTHVVLVGDNTTGGQQPFIDNGSLTYNGSTNVLSAGGFSGDGSSLTSLNASQLTSGTISGDRGVTSGSTSSSFVEYNGTTKTAGQFDGGTTDPTNTTRLNYDGYLYATRFYGDGSNLSALNASNISSGTIGDAYLPASISSDITGNAATATDATNFTVSANNSTDETVYPVFVDGATGTQGAETDTALSYNPSTNILTAGTFSGSGDNLTGISTNFVSAIGIQSAGVAIGAGITQLNFIGAGNTFAVDGTTVNISIAGGGSIGTTGITTQTIFSNPNIISEAYVLDNPNHNYAMFGPVSIGATVTVGAGNTFVII